MMHDNPPNEWRYETRHGSSFSLGVVILCYPSGYNQNENLSTNVVYYVPHEYSVYVNDLEALLFQECLDALWGVAGLAILQEVCAPMDLHELKEVILQNCLVTLSVHGSIFWQKIKSTTAYTAGKTSPDHHNVGTFHSFYSVLAVPPPASWPWPWWPWCTWTWTRPSISPWTSPQLWSGYRPLRTSPFWPSFCPSEAASWQQLNLASLGQSAVSAGWSARTPPAIPPCLSAAQRPSS